ncbi:hypothetical protein BHU24_17790 [Bacillus pseudomycoides]|uniref:hypothetical protein n=1 Tax=Bacillus pseudomycoides TaxID=64104 RepID=UPI000BECBD39|nr:hypothetical protein [Bacillus pseudomycoides]MBD5797054.1 hypothetical protein [Bacillus pseudomycoides]PDZ12304.1 hypothetical protein CON70_07245 [Bacillus pseudomycoides]PEE04569.1 hypothetical protein CON86_19245 [Bacillus pseudomycoides]PEO86147.1 hypothetical protein CN571_20045 [Bacillus pseudomycoides]PEP88601.1 hypothetical protein CN584_00260 [Bacillus pseudomycoides]
MKRAIKELQKSLGVEKRKLSDYEFKLKNLKEHEISLREGIADVKLTIVDIEETLSTLEIMTEGAELE